MAKTVLVVEDVADIQEMMKFLLESYEYLVFTADDGYEAVEKVKEYHPDLVLMDIMMPRLDGISATRIIREFDGQVPIIALTAFNDDYHQKALEAGCNGVIPKPVDLDNLKSRLDQYLA